MPADDLTLALRIRADVQQAVDALRDVNARLDATQGSGRRAGRSLRDLGQAAHGLGDAHEELGARTEAVYAAMAESAREAAQEQAKAGESWTESMRAGLERLRRDAGESAHETRAATVDAFRAMEDAIAAFATTGRLSFAGFVDSVIADLARLAVRRTVTAPLADLLTGALSGVAADGAGGRRTLPPALFDGAPRFHSGGVAGLRPDGGIAGLRPEEVPVILQRGEGVFTPAQMRALGAPSVTVQIENRGTPQRVVSREVRLDPRDLVVTIVTEDLRHGGPIRQTLAQEVLGGVG